MRGSQGLMDPSSRQVDQRSGDARGQRTDAIRDRHGLHRLPRAEPQTKATHSADAAAGGRKSGTPIPNLPPFMRHVTSKCELNRGHAQNPRTCSHFLGLPHPHTPGDAFFFFFLFIFSSGSWGEKAELVRPPRGAKLLFESRAASSAGAPHSCRCLPLARRSQSCTEPSAQPAMSTSPQMAWESRGTSQHGCLGCWRDPFRSE